MKQKANIMPEEEHNYVLNFEFIETGENQDYNIDAQLSGKINIIETNLVITDVAVGTRHNLALDEDGNLYAWGNNLFGQLGDGTTETRETPIRINTDIKFKKISAGWFNSLAIDVDDNLYAWGVDSVSEWELINPRVYDIAVVPTLVSEGIKFKEISTTDVSCLAIDEEGNIYNWGVVDFDYEKIMNSNTVYVPDPTMIVTENKFNEISTAGDQNLAIDQHGDVYRWGVISFDISDMQNPIIEKVSTPTKLELDAKFKKVKSLNMYSLALDEDGNIYHWGTMRHVYDPSLMEDIGEPTQLTSGIIFETISIGATYLALDRDGQLYHWGFIPGDNDDVNKLMYPEPVGISNINL